MLINYRITHNKKTPSFESLSGSQEMESEDIKVGEIAEGVSQETAPVENILSRGRHIVSH